jgi:hypothetical protein
MRTTTLLAPDADARDQPRHGATVHVHAGPGTLGEGTLGERTHQAAGRRQAQFSLVQGDDTEYAGTQTGDADGQREDIACCLPLLHGAIEHGGRRQVEAGTLQLSQR